LTRASYGLDVLFQAAMDVTINRDVEVYEHGVWIFL
jgi:hypothetical protein